MKSLREDRRARGAEAKRRAQMYLSQLRWLEGFAVDGRWYVLDGEPDSMVLDGLTLSRARRIVNTLRRDYASSLPTLVDDVSAWLATMDGVITRLGRQVHENVAPDGIDGLVSPRVHKTVRALEVAHPSLRPLIRAAVGAWVSRPEVLAAALAWMKSRAPSLTRLIDGTGPDGLRRALRLARLGLEHESGVDALLALMRVEVAGGQESAARLANLIRRLRGTEPVAAPSAVGVHTWIDQLLQWTAGERAGALTLLALADVAGALEPWLGWQAEHVPGIVRAQAFVEQGIDRGPSIEHVRRLIARLERAQAAAPRAFPLDEVLSAIERLAEARHEPLHRALVRLLSVRRAWDSPVSRAHFVRHAADVAAADEEPLRAIWLWESLAHELEAGAPVGVLGPWKKILAGKPRTWLEHELLEDARRSVDAKRLAAGLARIAVDGPASEEHARRLGSALSGGLDAEAAAVVVRRLDGFEERVSRHLVGAALALAGDDRDAVAPLLRLMCSRIAGRCEREKVLADLCQHAASTGGAWVIRGLLSRDAVSLIDVVDLAAVVPRRSWPKLESDAPAPRWIAAYPPALAGALARLARVDPDAEQSARRRLADDFPDPAALEREAATLRARPQLGAKEARRLHHLQRRVTSPKSASPARLAHLAAKIEAAAMQIGGSRLAATLAAAAQARVLTALGFDNWAGYSPDRAQWSLLVALVRLEPAHRALAARLLRARAGPPPWDLRDDPVNRAFLARLSAGGIEPSPWLDDAPRVVTAADGAPLELGLCGDPLEVFAMGYHFHTCLAPTGSNFFSVVTNAADVNKRVLYARRDGSVVGRCLLALTDNGDVLTFHPYAHDKHLAFPEVVRDYASELATRMGSRVATSGRVALLLGRDWYDDGARDLVGRYEALAGVELLTAIQEVAPSGLIALLEKALGRPIDDITLPLILAMPPVEHRPDFIEPLAPYLLACPTLPDETLLTAARLAMRNGDPMLADRLLTGPAARTRFDNDAWSLGEILARTRPSFTLARLRQTRPRGVRRWSEEHGERLAVAGLALEGLCRPRQAALFYRQAIADEPWLADSLRPRLAELEKRGA